jgi:integrase
MSPAEATRLLDAIADLDDGRWHAMGVVMAFGGLRVGEASALTLSDIDADRRTVRINKNLSRPAGGPVIGPTKTQAGNRNIELSQSVIDSVQRHISKFIAVQTPTSLLFTSADGGYYHSSNFHRDIWKPALKTARLADKGYHVHDLRHFHGTQLAQLGYSAADIAKRLGDSSLAAALRYIDANPNNDARMAKSLEKMAKKAVKAG